MKKTLYTLAILLLAACSGERPPQIQPGQEKPAIFPDYADVTIPAGIAPMNFNINDTDADIVFVTITGSKGGSMETSGKWADFDSGQWHDLTARNAGGDLTFDVSVKRTNGQWHRYAPFKMHVSDKPLDDYGVVYRKIAPGYQTFSKTGIYRRELATFDEKPVLEETAVNGQCLNCHYSNRGRGDQFTIHVRGANGGTIVRNGEDCTYLNTKTPETVGNCTYGFWHPDGRYIAYNLNRIYQNFYLDKDHLIEPWDAVSDIVVLDTQTNSLIISPLLSTDAFETTPAFSPDGKKIYFCKSDYAELPKDYDKVKYSLCRIDFDAASGKFGEKIDTLISADSIDMSVSLPRPSYDGRYLMYNLTSHGTSPIHRDDADLYIMDLNDGTTRQMTEINSPKSDAYHNWSCDGNGWFLFNSKRKDGMYANIYIALMGDDGKATKPFLLPQRNPRKYYDEALHSFNAPDFLASDIRLDPIDIHSTVMSSSPVNVTLRSAQQK